MTKIKLNKQYAEQSVLYIYSEQNRPAERRIKLNRYDDEVEDGFGPDNEWHVFCEDEHDPVTGLLSETYFKAVLKAMKEAHKEYDTVPKE